MKTLVSAFTVFAFFCASANTMAEPIAITDCGTVVTEPGEYVLTHDLDCPDTPFSVFSVRIESEDVSFDCDGYHITGSRFGVQVFAPDVQVENCIIHDLIGDTSSVGIQVTAIGPQSYIGNNIVYGVGRFGLNYYLKGEPVDQIVDNIFCFSHEGTCESSETNSWEAADMLFFSVMGDLAQHNVCDYILQNDDSCENAIPCDTTCEAIDPDADLIPEGADNCPNDYNPRQADEDNNGIGDLCEIEEPVGLGWDESASLWSLVNGQGSISENARQTTYGEVSLQMDGDNYRTFASSTVSTDEILAGSTSLGMDVYVDSDQSNIYWIGAIQLFVHCPSAGVYNAYQGQIELSELVQDEFVPVEFPLNSAALETIASTYDDFSIRLSVLTNSGSAPILVDNIWFY